MTDVAEVLAALGVQVCECGHATRIHSLHGCQTILATLTGSTMGPPCPCRLTSRDIQARAIQPLIDAEKQQAVEEVLDEVERRVDEVDVVQWLTPREARGIVTAVREARRPAPTGSES